MMSKTAKKFTFTAAVFLLFVGTILCLEVLARRAPHPQGLKRWQFFTVFSLDRWNYLTASWEYLKLETVMENPPHERYVEEPEKNRPAFDHVPYAFEVQTNELGFRDASFSTTSSKRIALLGDSVAFGKGVREPERFSSIFEERSGHRVYNMALQGCTAECMTMLWKQHGAGIDVDTVIVQGSGNDMDQALWREATKGRRLWLSQWALQLVQKYEVMQWLVYLRNPSYVNEQLELAGDLALEQYGQEVEALFQLLEQQKKQIVFLHLPYAYGHFYAGHVAKACSLRSSCSEIRPDFELTEDLKETIRQSSSLAKVTADFVDRTLQTHRFSEPELEDIFIFREYFHDIVHLNPIGHEAVAQSLMAKTAGP